MKLFLIGFSCSGKSTLGPILAEKLDSRFYDLDREISKTYKKSIPEIFKKDGEKKFREYERERLNKLVNQNRSIVVALGGGAFQSPVNREIIERAGISIYLSCAKEELYRRLKKISDRPLMTGKNSQPLPAGVLKERISSLISKRRKNYLKADITISTTDKTVNETVERIIKKLKNYGTN